MLKPVRARRVITPRALHKSSRNNESIWTVGCVSSAWYVSTFHNVGETFVKMVKCDANIKLWDAQACSSTPCDLSTSSTQVQEETMKAFGPLAASQARGVWQNFMMWGKIL